MEKERSYNTVSQFTLYHLPSWWKIWRGQLRLDKYISSTLHDFTVTLSVLKPLYFLAVTVFFRASL